MGRPAGDVGDGPVRHSGGYCQRHHPEEYARKNWFTDVIEINITNLAGVPSIVYGLLALGLFVYTFGFGQSILSRLTFALLILPIVIVATREACAPFRRPCVKLSTPVAPPNGRCAATTSFRTACPAF